MSRRMGEGVGKGRVQEREHNGYPVEVWRSTSSSSYLRSGKRVPTTKCRVRRVDVTDESPSGRQIVG